MSSLADLGIGLLVILALGFLCVTAIRPTRTLAGGRSIRTRAHRPSTLRLYAAHDPEVWVRALLVALALNSLTTDLEASPRSELWPLFALCGLIGGVLTPRLDSPVGALSAVVGLVILVIDHVPWSVNECSPPPGTVPGSLVVVLVLLPFGLALVIARHRFRRSVARSTLGLQAFALVDLARFLAQPNEAALVPVIGAAPAWIAIASGSVFFSALLVASPGLALVLGGVMVGLAQLLLQTAYPDGGCAVAPSYGALLATVSAFLAYLLAAGVRERAGRR